MIKTNKYEYSSTNPANIRLQGVLIKTNIFALAIRLQDVFKTFSRRLEQDHYIRLGHTSSRRPAKTSSRHLQDVLARRLQDIFQTSSRFLAKSFQDIFKTSSKDVFKTFSRHIIRLNCLPRSRIYLSDTSEKFMISVENLQVW